MRILFSEAKFHHDREGRQKARGAAALLRLQPGLQRTEEINHRKFPRQYNTFTAYSRSRKEVSLPRKTRPLSLQYFGTLSHIQVSKQK